MTSPRKQEDQDAAFDRHTQDGFHCTDPGCMFPAQPWTWCTRGAR